MFVLIILTLKRSMLHVMEQTFGNSDFFIRKFKDERNVSGSEERRSVSLTDGIKITNIVLQKIHVSVWRKKMLCQLTAADCSSC